MSSRGSWESDRASRARGGDPALERPFDIYVSKICAFAKSLA